uniref:Uncharacterized protein n=1 Tax=Amphimedon queenslandica TaxID=400682 RepID=A0A1X7V1Z7_AMPQE
LEHVRIIIRFRIFQITLIADIEKAFLMISVAPKDRDKINKAKGVPLYVENLELKVLGIHLEVLQDQLVFKPADAVNLEMIASPTKWLVVSAVSQFYDPLGLLLL